MSQRLSGSDGGSALDAGQQQPSSFYIYGMYFCGTCKNIMTPMKQRHEQLEFRCKLCDKKSVNFTKIEGKQCIIYHKQLKPGSKAAKIDRQFVMDPTIAKVELQCPQCGSQEGAYYIVTPDDFESSIQVKLICANISRCDHTWVLPLNQRIEGLKIIDLQ